jgi:hypothetical protein
VIIEEVAQNPYSGGRMHRQERARINSRFSVFNDSSFWHFVKLSFYEPSDLDRAQIKLLSLLAGTTLVLGQGRGDPVAHRDAHCIDDNGDCAL